MFFSTLIITKHYIIFVLNQQTEKQIQIRAASL